MPKNSTYQLELFPAGSHVVFSDHLCLLCQSDIHVINALVNLPNEQFSRFVHLCENCRSKPWLFKE